MREQLLQAIKSDNAEQFKSAVEQCSPDIIKEDLIDVIVQGQETKPNVELLQYLLSLNKVKDLDNALFICLSNYNGHKSSIKFAFVQMLMKAGAVPSSFTLSVADKINSFALQRIVRRVAANSPLKIKWQYPIDSSNPPSENQITYLNALLKSRALKYSIKNLDRVKASALIELLKGNNFWKYVHTL